MNYTLMNVPMTKATIEDRKTNTRRAIKGVDGYEFSHFTIEENLAHFVKEFGNYKTVKPKYQIGETIWVREPARVFGHDLQFEAQWVTFQYSTDEKIISPMIVPERFMVNSPLLPEWMENCQGIPNGCIKEMVRIFLKVTDVRVERLQDMTFEDIVKEGLRYSRILLENGVTIENQLRRKWINLWNSTAPKGYKYLDNPFVFCYTFEVIDKKEI